MNTKQIDFKTLEWEKPGIGVEQKQFLNGNQRIRLLRFYDDFIEDNWCVKGHIGYVIDGEMTINFSGNLVQFKKGDGVWIETDKDSKHKVLIPKGKFVELILFENI